MAKIADHCKGAKEFARCKNNKCFKKSIIIMECQETFGTFLIIYNVAKTETTNNA